MPAIYTIRMVYTKSELDGVLEKLGIRVNEDTRRALIKVLRYVGQAQIEVDMAEPDYYLKDAMRDEGYE